VQLIEEFLTPPLRERTLARLGKLALELSIVSAGGPMHTREAAEATRAEVSSNARRLAGNAEYFGFTISPWPDGKPKNKDALRIQAYQVNRTGEEIAHTGVGMTRAIGATRSHAEPQLAGLCLDLDCAVRPALAEHHAWKTTRGSRGWRHQYGSDRVARP
jgi:hypothetical protein